MLAQLLDRRRRLGPQRVAQTEEAGGAAVDHRHHRRLAVGGRGGEVEAARARARRSSRSRSLSPRSRPREHPRRAHRHLAALDRRLDAEPGSHLEADRRRQRQAAGARGVDHGASEQMLGRLLGGGGETQHGVGVEAGGRIDSDQRGTAEGERAGLVERDGVDRRQALDRLAALDQHALAAQPRDRRRHRRRRRQHQRARAGDDERRHRAHHLAGGEVDGGAREQRRRQEEARHAIGDAHDRRAPALRLVDQPDDARHRGVGADPLGLDLERAVLVDAAAPDRVAGALLGRHRLAGDPALVDGRDAAAHPAVDRHGLARPHHDDLAEPHLLGRHLDLDAGAEHPGEPRLRRDEAFDRAPGAVHREVLEPLAEQHDEHDLGGGEVLADGDRGAGGDRDRQVRREVAAQQVFERVAQQRETGDDGEQQRDVEAGDAGEDAGYVEDEQGRHRGAEQRVAPARRAVAVAVPMVMVATRVGPGIVIVIAVVGLGLVEEALTHAGRFRKRPTRDTNARAPASGARRTTSGGSAARSPLRPPGGGRRARAGRLRPPGALRGRRTARARGSRSACGAPRPTA